MKRRIGSLLVVAVLLVSLCATGVSALAEQPIELRIAWWGSQTRHDNTMAAIDMYMARNPNVKIEAQYMSWDGYWEMMAAQIAGGNMPDIYQQDYQYLQQYADKGLMYNLNEYIENGTINTDNIDENTLKGGMVDGNVFAISLGLNSQCVVWDPEMFEQAGVESPKDDWTWDEYIATIKTLHEKLGVYGEEYFASSYFHGPNLWLRQHGESFYAQDGSGLGYTDDQLLADYYQMDLDLVKIGAVPGPDIRNEIKNPESQLMITGQAAMLGALGGSNQLAAMVNAAGKQFKLAPLPHYTGETSGQFLKPSQFFSIASTTKYPEECAKFLDFVTNDVEANLECLKGERGVPISSAIREAMAPTLDETQQEIYRYIDAVSTFAFPIGKPEPPQHAELDGIIRNVQFKILTEQVTPLDGAKEIRAEAERVFAGN